MKKPVKFSAWFKDNITFLVVFFTGCCFSLISATYPVTAQNYSFQEYTVLDGLPQTQTKSLFEDSRGFLWIMTRNGISRFNGIEFKNYYRKDGLSSNIINQIFEDNKGHIWALSSDGLSKYDGYTFCKFPYNKKLLSEEFCYAHDRGDTIFLFLRNIISLRCKIVYFKDGVYNNYPKKTSVLDTLAVSSSFYDNSSGFFILFDADGNVWKWRNEELIHFNGIKTERITNDRGRILIEGKGKRYKISDGGIMELQFGKDSVRTEVSEDNSGKNESILLYKDDMISKINTPNYSTILIDSETNIWFGSEVNLYKLTSTAFYYFDEKNGLPKDTWAIAEDNNGHMWFGSLTGDLLEFDGKKFIPRNEYKKLFNGSPAFFKGTIRGSDGKVYFSLNLGVLVWDGMTFSKLAGIPDGTQICIIYEDPLDKSLLFGTSRGLFHFKNGKMNIFPEFNSTGYGIIEGIVRDDDGIYWLSGQNGIITFNGEKAAQIDDTLMPSGYSYTLVKDNMGGIWVTSEWGLFFKRKSSVALSYGLPEEINGPANSIIVMDSSHIMVGRMADICIIDIEKFYNNDPDYFKIYDKTFGFMGSECLDNGILKDKEGKYWILASGKAVVLDDNKLGLNKYPPRVSVTDVEYETDSLEWKSLQIPGLFYNEQNEIRINHRFNNIRIKFTGISMTNPTKVMYEHRLTGIEKIWSGKNYEREVIYKNLRPGNYDFQLKAFNSDGIETPDIYSLKIILVPGIMQTFAFKTVSIGSAILLVVFLTIWLTRLNIKKKSKEIRIRNELSRLQMNSIIKQFDPHFTFNVISSVGALIMDGKKNAAYNYVVTLSNLLRTVLVDGSIMVRTLSEELDFVKRYCELQKLRFKERLIYSFHINENINLQRLIPKMTIQTFVENSIKHGIENRIEGGEVFVRIEENNNTLEIIVSDNGVGRKIAGSLTSKREGYGLRTINGIFEFLNRINKVKAKIEIKDLDDGNNNATGTEVKITIPDDYDFELTASSGFN